jgi:hypothetical protein
VPPPAATAAATGAPPPPAAACSASCPRLPPSPTCSKIFISLLAGCFTGIAGFTGFKGFVVYLLAHLLMGGLLMAKAAMQPTRFFPSS